MRKIVYAPDYREKLIQLRDSLDTDYGQATRRKILLEIDQHIQHLKQYPFLGISVRAMYGIECDYYYLHVGKNVVFYSVGDLEIAVLNMYNDREEYLIKFLGSRTKLNEEGASWTEK